MLGNCRRTKICRSGRPKRQIFDQCIGLFPNSDRLGDERNKKGRIEVDPTFGGREVAGGIVRDRPRQRRALKTRCVIASIEPMPEIERYFGAPAVPTSASCV